MFYKIKIGAGVAALLLLAFTACDRQAKNAYQKDDKLSSEDTLKKSKVLFVFTSTTTKGTTGEKTGFTLTEAAQPWLVFSDAGYEMDFASPKGGKVSVDTLKFEDQGDHIFWNDQGVQSKLNNTLLPQNVKIGDYMAVFFVGGHGTMWDFADSASIAKLAVDVYEKGGIVGSVCHGAAALINAKLSTGQYIIDGKNITGFTNAEEKEVKMDKVVPFLLETELVKKGGKFIAKPNWQANVQVADRLVTGQNPASAKGVGEEMVKLLKNIAAR